MITEILPVLKIHKLTQEQYDREFAAGNIDENALYLTPDDTFGDGFIKIGETIIKENDFKKMLKMINTPRAEGVGF